MPHERTPPGYWDEFTHETLARAGLAPGMRVLDVGCGTGDLTIAAATLVGPGGEVVGVDRDVAALDRAATRASGAELANVEFIAAELRSFEPPGLFDALIGRFVLRHVPDAAAALRRLTPALVPGGIVAFIEADWVPARAVPTVPLVDETLGRLRGAMQQAAIQLDLGPRLWRVFRSIGVEDVDVRLGVRADPPPATAAVAMLVERVAELLPVMERCGIAPAGEIDPGTLAQQLSDALLERQATLLGPIVAGATGHLTR